VYFLFEYDRLAIYSQGTYTRHDLIVGLLVFLLVMELDHVSIIQSCSGTNVVMIVYTLYGYLFSALARFLLASGGDLLSRGSRRARSNFSTGILRHVRPARTHVDCCLPAAGRRRQCVQTRKNAMINVVRLIARSRRLIPQTAVLGSSAIGLISGSGVGQRRRGRHHDDSLNDFATVYRGPLPPRSRPPRQWAG